jgi:hypothetical protein
MATRRPYAEGDWFGVPLPSGGWAVGVAARCEPGEAGTVLGYFFGPRRTELPTPADLENVHADETILVAIFGDLGLIEESWPRLGSHSRWIRTEWTMPAFGRESALSDAYWKIHYDPEDPAVEREQTRITRTEFDRLPADGLYGAGAIEETLERLLNADDAPGNGRSELGGSQGEGESGPVRFYLYFPNEEAARTAAKALLADGLETETHLGADEQNWLVLTSATIPSSEITTIEQKMEALAKAGYGEYDGMEREAN